MNEKEAKDQREAGASQILEQARLRSILDRDPAVKAGVNMVENAIHALDALQAELLPQQEKNLEVPDAAQRTLKTQTQLAIAIDTVNKAMQHCKDQEVIQLGLGVQSVGVQYFQGIFFSIHYSRVVYSHQGDRTFQRLLDTAYKLFERSRQQKVGVVHPT